ncbi:MAG: chemotaxis protein CheW [Acidobacteria bacterium]|nr:chemotaxis protein CheW [Acidobacteriota bacterium]
MDDKELIQEFLVESYENLSQLNREIVELESRPTDAKLLDSVFRVMHTLKGTCGFLGFSNLERVAHFSENLLSQLRGGDRLLTAELASLLLEVADEVRGMLSEIETTGQEPAKPPEGLVVRLETACRNEAMDPATAVKARLDTELHPAQKAASISDSSIRVNVPLLDRLMNLVGELVLARNQITQVSNHVNNAVLMAASQRLDLVTTELQQGVMKTRMQPIGVVWDQLPRQVRDLSCNFGKQIRLEMEGAETELDKTIIEAVKDPITHIVRNCCDHGIELPEARRIAGKPPAGRIWLRARHESGQVVIEIGDDGAGIDTAKLRGAAKNSGRFTAGQVERMTREEVINLIFLPGLSTAKDVTKISGRGVGMDVVRTNVERIGGTVDVAGEEGTGSTIRLRIPLTLAIIPGLLVSAHSSDRSLPFIIPQASVAELVRVDERDRSLETVQDRQVYRLRGKLLPVVHLSQMLGLRDRGVSLPGAKNMVVVQAEDRLFGLIVDDLHDTEEIVVKPLGHHLKGLTCYAGATILGDGRVALILDVAGLSAIANVFVCARQTDARQAARAGEQTDRETLLLLRAGSAAQLAIPLARVSRLEEFPSSRLEVSAGRTAVQYRGGILPLVPLGELLGYGTSPADRSGTVRTIVLERGGRIAGLIVDEISDIVEAHIDSLEASDRFGLKGSAVVNHRVTDLLDTDPLLSAAFAYGRTNSSGVQALALAVNPHAAAGATEREALRS